EVQNLPRAAIAFHCQQTVWMVRGNRGVGLDRLQFHRKPNLKIELTNPRQEPVKIIRRCGAGPSSTVGVRIKTHARAPFDVEQERFGTDGGGILSEAQYCLTIMVSERRSTSIEDHSIVMRRFGLQVPMQARGSGGESIGPCSYHPSR